jgi:hypothetical protein
VDPGIDEGPEFASVAIALFTLASSRRERADTRWQSIHRNQGEPMMLRFVKHPDRKAAYS